MSAPAIRTWNDVTREQLENALASLHPDDRPSYDATVAVGLSLAVLTNGKKGYCDSTTRQIYDYLKGAYGEYVIRNALWALQVAGVVANVQRGTKGKDGKGRGAHRVFIGADTNDLIPDGYTPPPPRRVPPTGHDLSQTYVESDTGRSEIATGISESHTGHDMSTPKESISSSTAALAGRSTTEDSLGLVDAEESEMPPRCETCATTFGNSERIDRLTLASISDDNVTAGLSQNGRKLLRKEMLPYAVVLLKHYPERPQSELAVIMQALASTQRRTKLFGQARHTCALDVAAQLLD